MGLAELRELARDGWEIASHSLFHRRLTSLPLSYDDEKADWRYDRDRDVFVADYPWEEVATVICDGHFLKQRHSLAELRASPAGFTYERSRRRLYARPPERGQDDPSLLFGSAQRELAQSRSVLEKNGFEIRSFIVPFSVWPEHLQGLGARYYDYVSSVRPGSNTGASAFLHRFTAFSDRSVAEVIATIEYHLRQGSWCILCFHEVVAEIKNRLDWPVAAFRQLVEWVDAQGIPVDTLSKGGDRLAAGTAAGR